MTPDYEKLWACYFLLLDFRARRNCWGRDGDETSQPRCLVLGFFFTSRGDGLIIARVVLGIVFSWAVGFPNPHRVRVMEY